MLGKMIHWNSMYYFFTNTYNIAFIHFRIIRYMKINLSKGMSEFNGNCCINKHPNPLQLQTIYSLGNLQTKIPCHIAKLDEIQTDITKSCKDNKMNVMSSKNGASWAPKNLPFIIITHLINIYTFHRFFFFFEKKLYCRIFPLEMSLKQLA